MRSERNERQKPQITIHEFEKLLPRICDAKIAAYPGSWTPENPLYSACVPVTIVAHKIFGGKFLRADLRPFPEFKHMRYHWVNLLANGKIKDFTEDQFGDNYPKGMKFVEKSPSIIVRIPGAVYRSNLLYRRLLKKYLDSQ